MVDGRHVSSGLVPSPMKVDNLFHSLRNLSQSKKGSIVLAVEKSGSVFKIFGKKQKGFEHLFEDCDEISEGSTGFGGPFREPVPDQ